MGDMIKPQDVGVTFKSLDQESPQHFNIGEVRFIALPPSRVVYFARSTSLPSYVTVILLPRNCLSVEEDWLKKTIANYESFDDVFNIQFLSGIMFIGTSNTQVTPGANKYLQSIGTGWIEVVDAAGMTSTPPPGPFYVLGEKLFQIWRLHDDSQGAFLTALVPDKNGRPWQLRVGGEALQNIAVAVPSRLGVTVSSSKPLLGWRVAVKDIFQIEGLKTSVCNRAYYELYPPASRTAACIKLLEDKGAYVLGTTKLAAFAATEEPIECVDYQAPWNPRADGYQSPAGSSSGSGVAVASYEWVDIAIGSDTSGSGRRPGHWNGCFAHRPSHGVLPIEGYIPSFEQFDTPTFFGRTVEICKKFAESWYGDKLYRKESSFPPAIIYPIEYMSLITNKDQLEIISNFVADLERSLGVKHEKVSFDERWDSDPPEEANGESLQEFMRDASRNSFFHDDYHAFDAFRIEYQNTFSKTPYVSPPVRWQWNLSAGISKKEREIAVYRLEVYRRWCSDTILKVGTLDTIILIPIENMSPRYRDEPLGRYFNPVGVPMLFVAPILKAPEFTVPIGQVPFKSKVTGNTEHIPVAISLLGAPGRDLEIMDIARDCLVKAGRPTKVLTGAKLFPESP